MRLLEYMSSKIHTHYKLISICVLLILFIIVGCLWSGPVVTSILLRGFCTGALYGMLAMGLTIVFGVMKIINVAHGQFIVLSAYLTYWLYILFGISPFIGIIISSLTFFILGLPLGKFLINPALKGGINPPFIISFGIALFLENIMRLAWTATPRVINIDLGVIFILPEVRLPVMSLITLLVAVIGIMLTHIILSKTFFGKAIRAVAMDSETASLMGINPSHINTVTYAIGLLLAGISGSLFSIMLSFDPTTGNLLISKAMCIVVLGSVGYLPGALFGGLVLGVAESVGSLFLGDLIRDAVAYILFLLVLLFKPTGLFAKYRAF